MNLENFQSIIDLLKEQQRRTDLATALRIDLVEFADPMFQIVDILIREVYGDDGYDWFTWFCYDNEFGDRDWKEIPCFTNGITGKLSPANARSADVYGAYDSNGNPICFDVKSTWEFLEKNYRKSAPLKKTKPTDINNLLKVINGSK